MTEEQTTDHTTENEHETFPRSYVEELRQEAAESRVKAKSADDLRERLRASAVREASAGVLHEPITWSDEFDGEDGFPDAEKIAAAVEALADEKPWLSRPRGDVGAGFRGDDAGTVDLAALMRG